MEINPPSPSSSSRMFDSMQSKWQRVIKPAAGFFVVQILTQFLGFFSGLLVIHAMSKSQYGLYTVANTMQSTIILLANIGAHSALNSLGGSVWQDKLRLGELLQSALRVRRTLSLIASPLIGCFMLWMLAQQGCGLWQALTLTALVIATVQCQLLYGVMVVIPQLNTRVKVLQKLDFIPNSLRLILLQIASFLYLNAIVAIAANFATLFLQSSLAKRWASGDVELKVDSKPEDEKAIWHIVHQQAPAGIYFCFQSQITLFLLSSFGHANTVAEVGAVGRLSALFAVIASMVGNLLVPRFARCQNPRLLKKMYWQSITGIVALSAVLVGIAFLFPDPLLFLLGKKYSQLHQVFIYLVLATVFQAISGVIIALNLAKAWMKHNWMFVPCTIVFQLLLLPFLNLGNTIHVILFSFVPSIPSLLIYFYDAHKEMSVLTHKIALESSSP